MGQLFSSWQPDLRCASVHQVPWEALFDNGMQTALFDLDNTLGPWGSPGLPQATLTLLARLRKRGVAVGVLTNSGLAGRRTEIETPLHALGVPLCANARKPLKSGYRRLLGLLKVEPGPGVVAVGDQWWTDVIGAKRMGLRAVLVSPLDPTSEPRWARWRHWVERWFLDPA